MKKIARFAMLAMGLALSSLSASANDWQPTKPIRLIVVFAPGGSADALARILQPRLSEELKGTVVVENLPGAGGNIGTAAFAHAAPDGYTLGIGSQTSHGVNPAIFGDKLPYKVPDNFTPIGQIVSQPSVILVNPKVPATNMQEFVRWLQSNPGESFGTAGVGTSNHLGGELINEIFKVKLSHVPYKGGGLALQDLMGGHLKIVIDNVSTAAPLVTNGQARAIAVLSAKRSSRLPDVPSLAEQGAPDFDLTPWQGLFGPAGLPDNIKQTISKAMTRVLNDPAIQARLRELGANPIGSSPEEFERFLATDLPKWSNLAKRVGLKP